MRTSFFVLVLILPLAVFGGGNDDRDANRPAAELRIRDGIGMGRFTDEKLAKDKYRKVTFFVSKIMYDGTVSVCR